MRGWMRAGRGLRVLAVTGVLVVGTGGLSAMAADVVPDDGAVVAPVAAVPVADDGAAGDAPQPGAEPATPVESAEPVESVEEPAEPVEPADSGESAAPGEEAPGSATADDLAEATPAAVEDEDVIPGAVAPLVVTMDPLVVAAGGAVTVDYQAVLLAADPTLSGFVPTEATAPAEGALVVDGEAVSYRATASPTTATVEFALSVDSGGLRHTVQGSAVVLALPQAQPMYAVTSPGVAGIFPLDPSWGEYTDLYTGLPEFAPRIVAVAPIDPAVGSATITDDGWSVTFTQAQDDLRAYEFGYVVEDALGRRADGVATVQMLPRLTGTRVALTTTTGHAVSLDAMQAAGGDHPYLWSSVADATAAGGSVSAPWGVRQVTYTPRPGFVGTDSFTVTVWDASGQRVAVDVDVTVEAAIEEVTTDANLPTAPARTTLATTGGTANGGLPAAVGALLTGGGLLLLRRRLALRG